MRRGLGAWFHRPQVLPGSGQLGGLGVHALAGGVQAHQQARHVLVGAGQVSLGLVQALFEGGRILLHLGDTPFGGLDPLAVGVDTLAGGVESHEQARHVLVGGGQVRLGSFQPRVQRSGVLFSSDKPSFRGLDAGDVGIDAPVRLAHQAFKPGNALVHRIHLLLHEFLGGAARKPRYAQGHQGGQQQQAAWGQSGTHIVGLLLYCRREPEA